MSITLTRLEFPAGTCVFHDRDSKLNTPTYTNVPASYVLVGYTRQGGPIRVCRNHAVTLRGEDAVAACEESA
jgi:hypothetical protein